MSLHNVYRERLPRHSHNISERRYFDMKMGLLVPFYCREMYPGDKVKIGSNVVIESRTLSAPLKNNVRFREYWFFVPRRLMWKNWEKFIFGGKSGDYTAVYPYMTYGGSATTPFTLSVTGVTSLLDYLGFPTVPNDGSLTNKEVYDYFEKIKIDAMPFAAYQMIYKDWFRNENFSDDSWDFENSGSAWLQDGRNNTIKDEDGNNITSTSDINGSNSLHHLRQAPWSKTYFTAALPFRQRGTANRVPLHGTAFLKTGTVDSDGNFVPGSNTSQIRLIGQVRQNDPLEGWIFSDRNIATVPGSLSTSDGFIIADNDNTEGASTHNTQRLIGSSSTGAYGISGSDLQGFTITELRLLAKLQEFAEINARFGFRYIEGLRGHFGVSPTDARLDRPEFIGGMHQDIVVSEVLQTSETGTTPLGTPAGRGISASTGRIGSYYAEEHGILMGICSIMPEQIYTQGIPRMWTRRTKEEFFSPEFNGLSEQEIKESEVYSDHTMNESQLNTVFGYVPAWEELRHGKTMAVGNLRNPNQADLYAWTQARQFTSAPTLGNNFLYGSTDNSNGGIRTDAWTTGNLASQFFVSMNNRIHLISTVSKSGVPGITRI